MPLPMSAHGYVVKERTSIYVSMICILNNETEMEILIAISILHSLSHPNAFDRSTFKRKKKCESKTKRLIIRKKKANMAPTTIAMENLISSIKMLNCLNKQTNK